MHRLGDYSNTDGYPGQCGSIFYNVLRQKLLLSQKNDDNEFLSVTVTWGLYLKFHFERTNEPIITNKMPRLPLHQNNSQIPRKNVFVTVVSNFS